MNPRLATCPAPRITYAMSCWSRCSRGRSRRKRTDQGNDGKVVLALLIAFGGKLLVAATVELDADHVFPTPHSRSRTALHEVRPVIPSERRGRRASSAAVESGRWLVAVVGGEEVGGKGRASALASPEIQRVAAAAEAKNKRMA